MGFWISGSNGPTCSWDHMLSFPKLYFTSRGKLLAVCWLKSISFGLVRESEMEIHNQVQDKHDFFFDIIYCNWSKIILIKSNTNIIFIIILITTSHINSYGKKKFVILNFLYIYICVCVKGRKKLSIFFPSVGLDNTGHFNKANEWNHKTNKAITHKT